MLKVNKKGFIVNFEHISLLCSSVSIVNFEQVNAGQHISNIRDNVGPHVKNEIAFSLTEDLIKLYICVRAFSFADDQKNFFKIKQSKLKARSLRKS